MTNLAKALLAPGLQHLIAGLAVIGAVAGLAATGTVSGTDALNGIYAVGGVLVGGTLAVASSATPSAQ